MAAIPTDTPNWLEKLRSITMADWIKTALGLAGIGIVMWSAVQQHGYRLDHLEHAIDMHLEKHERQNDEIQAALTQIQVQMARLTDEDPRPAGRSGH